MRRLIERMLISVFLLTAPLAGGESVAFTATDAAWLHSTFKEGGAIPAIPVGPRLFRFNEPDGSMGLIFEGKRKEFKGNIYRAAFYSRVASESVLNIENFFPPFETVRDIPEWPPLETRFLVCRQNSDGSYDRQLDLPCAFRENATFFPSTIEILADDEFGFITFEGLEVVQKKPKVAWTTCYKVFKIDDGQGIDLNPAGCYPSHEWTLSVEGVMSDVEIRNQSVRKNTDGDWSFIDRMFRENRNTIYAFQGRKFLFAKEVTPIRHKKAPTSARNFDAVSVEPDLFHAKKTISIVASNAKPIRRAKITARHYKRDSVSTYLSDTGLLYEWNRHGDKRGKYLLHEYGHGVEYLVFAEEHTAVTDRDGHFTLDGPGSGVLLRIEARGYEPFEKVFMANDFLPDAIELTRKP